MSNDLNHSIQAQLTKRQANIFDNLVELEMKLREEEIHSQREIDLHLEKQDIISRYFLDIERMKGEEDNIRMTLEFLETIMSIEDLTKMRISKIKKDAKQRELQYKLARKDRLESWIMDYKQGAVRTIGSTSHDSYIENVHYYQSQLSSLISSLSS